MPFRPEPRCYFGRPTDPETLKAPRYAGPDHCARCHAEVRRMVRRAAQRT